MTAGAFTELEEDILLNVGFDPVNHGSVYVVATNLVGELTVSIEEIEDALTGFETKGLVIRKTLPGVDRPAYQAQPLAYEAREAVLRARGLRHPALVNQRSFAIADLILALVMCPHIWNARMTGAFFGAEPIVTVRELDLYLADFSKQEVRDGCSDLVRQGLVVETKKSGTNEDALEVTGLGRQAYRTAVSPKLKLREGESLLDHQKKTFIEVFNAWQSEHNPARSAVYSALSEVVSSLNTAGGLTHPLKIVQATEPGDGAIRIDVALQEKIKKADFFVGDLTPVYAYGGRLRVNENVLVEVGFAMASKDPNQIVLLAMKRTDVPGDATNAKPAFDIDHVRRHEFHDKKGLRKWLETELETALKARGWLR